MERIDECISFLAGKAAQVVSRLAASGWSRSGSRRSNMPCCRPCGRPTGRAGRRSAARLVLDSATLTGVLDRLESARLIRREAHAHDRRINRIRLTMAGQGRREALQTCHGRAQCRGGAGLGAEADILWRLLRQLAGEPLAMREG